MVTALVVVLLRVLVLSIVPLTSLRVGMSATLVAEEVLVEEGFFEETEEGDIAIDTVELEVEPFVPNESDVVE